MRYVILVSHGAFAEGLKASLMMFAGDQAREVIALGLQKDETADHFGTRFAEAVTPFAQSDSIILLADIIGGSPLTTACNILSQSNRLIGTIILGGMNLPMALNALLFKDTLSGKEFVDKVLQEGTAALRQFEPAAQSQDDGDDI